MLYSYLEFDNRKIQDKSIVPYSIIDRSKGEFFIGTLIFSAKKRSYELKVDGTKVELYRNNYGTRILIAKETILAVPSELVKRKKTRDMQRGLIISVLEDAELVTKHTIDFNPTHDYSGEIIDVHWELKNRHLVGKHVYYDLCNNANGTVIKHVSSYYVALIREGVYEAATLHSYRMRRKKDTIVHETTTNIL